jgi:hypothetical protein
VFNKLRKEAFKSGISMAGLSRIVMESALGMKSGINSYPPHIKRERVVSDVTIRIQKGIKVRIV